MPRCIVSSRSGERPTRRGLVVGKGEAVNPELMLKSSSRNSAQKCFISEVAAVYGRLLPCQDLSSGGVWCRLRTSGDFLLRPGLRDKAAVGRLADPQELIESLRQRW